MWQFVAAVVVSLVATFALRPKPQTRPPDGINELEVPIAEEGTEIPVLFGCKRIKGPNVVWYGELDTEAIKSKSGKK